MWQETPTEVILSELWLKASIRARMQDLRWCTSLAVKFLYFQNVLPPKVVTHMMPDLPNVDLERDIQQFIEFFENPRFRPDGLKLYPTLVIR